MSLSRNLGRIVEFAAKPSDRRRLDFALCQGDAGTVRSDRKNPTGLTDFDEQVYKADGKNRLRTRRRSAVTRAAGYQRCMPRQRPIDCP